MAPPGKVGRKVSASFGGLVVIVIVWAIAGFVWTHFIHTAPSPAKYTATVTHFQNRDNVFVDATVSIANEGGTRGVAECSVLALDLSGNPIGSTNEKAPELAPKASTSFTVTINTRFAWGVDRVSLDCA